MDRRRFEGKTALVTGAARGIGAATAARLASEGAAVALVDLEAESCAEAVEAIAAAGGYAIALAADVSSPGDVDRAVTEACRSLGGIDILVGNAGIMRDGPVAELSDEDWDAVVDVNLRGSFLLARAVSPHMMERRSGKIVFVSSRAAFGREATSNYAAAKAGQIALARSLAYELGPFNVNVNAVAPGFVRTEMARAVARSRGREPEAFQAEFERTLALRRVGRPEDIAGVIAFLASDDASYVTGQVIVAAGEP